MVTRKQLSERLEDFEALSGIEYSRKACEIWYKHFKDWEEGRFNRYCDKVEKEIKWHILPTPGDIIKKAEIKKYV
jgi:hypothetical protein